MSGDKIHVTCLFSLMMFRPGPPVCVVSIVRSGDILQEAVRCSDT